MVADVTDKAVDFARRMGKACKDMGYAPDPDKYLGTMVEWETGERAEIFRNAYMDGFDN